MTLANQQLVGRKRGFIGAIKIPNAGCADSVPSARRLLTAKAWGESATDLFWRERLRAMFDAHVQSKRP